MGGHAAGEIASATAVETVSRTVVSKYLQDRQAPVDPVMVITEAFADANQAVWEKSHLSPDCEGMGTTLTAMLVIGQRFLLGHVGDCRAFLIRDAAIMQLTSDHTLSQEKLNAGELAPEDALISADRHLLTRVMGTRRSVTPDLYQGILQSGDVVIFCSDGAYHSLAPDEIAVMTSRCVDMQALCRRLVDVAKTRDGADNITVVCLEVGGRARIVPRRRQALPAVEGRRLVLAVLLVAVIAAMAMVVGMLSRRHVQPAGLQPVGARSTPPSTTNESPPAPSSSVPHQQSGLHARDTAPAPPKGVTRQVPTTGGKMATPSTPPRAPGVSSKPGNTPGHDPASPTRRDTPVSAPAAKPASPGVPPSGQYTPSTDARDAAKPADANLGTGTNTHPATNTPPGDSHVEGDTPNAR